MSNVKIMRAVENIKTGTTIYSPIVELIVNSIEAIEEKSEENGEVIIVVERSTQLEIDGSLPEVIGFKITDNGIGFTEEHRESFDTLYSDLKIKIGGKGFGRFVCLKYFNDLSVDSIYKDGDSYKERSFMMGKENDIIVNETIKDTDSTETGCTIRLISVKSKKFPDKKLKTIARNLAERILPFFISENYVCPKIIITEKDMEDTIVLNEFVSNELSAAINEIDVDEKSFSLNGINQEYNFDVRVFKFYSPKNQKSKISLVAHSREVTDTVLHHYVPEFVDEFYDTIFEEDSLIEKNYIIKAYVFSEYLDENVSYERGGFEFGKENDIFLGIPQSQIEREASKIAKSAIGSQITVRQEKKKKQIHSYVDECAPWHRELLEDIDLACIPYKPTDEDIEIILQKEKFNQDVNIKREINNLLADNDVENLKTKVTEIVRKISDTSKNELVHYVALRRNVLDIFQKSLELDPDGSYSSEGIVHDIIFPRKGDSEITSFENHNLWIIDERLNFTDYISSDLSINKSNTDRPDLLTYDKRVLFRGDNEPSNPVSIFEFKKPQRDDFVNPSSKEDPIQQIIRYVNKIREGDCKTPEGREILISLNTPFYGYVVCDLTKKVKKWLEIEKDFKPMPDRLGWFRWRENINLYIEVLSWDKVLKDATMRNKIFFHKLGI